MSDKIVDDVVFISRQLHLFEFRLYVKMSKYQLLPANCSICRSFIYVSAVWIVLLLCFYHLSDLELIEEHQRRRLSEDYNDILETKSTAAIADSIIVKTVNETNKFTPKQVVKTVEEITDKQLNVTTKEFPNPFVYKKLVTPIPEYIRKQLSLINPGENGSALDLKNVPPEIQQRIDRGWKLHEFDEFKSDLIALNRSLPDPRDSYCKQPNLYVKNLPATSVIFIFHNEAWSTLLRSVHSVLNRSPEHLITEIILVDDASTMPHLKKPLEEYFSHFPKVKILRVQQRGGLIKARILGAIEAKGPVLTFLDSHIEAAPGWLEPLLDRIARDPTTATCPVIDVIDDKDFRFSFQSSDGLQIGGFDWNLIFDWIMVPEVEKKRKKNPAEPTKSPTMAGGLFSIDKAFFEKLGMYDPGFDIWGAENLEISFKLWMCGGSLEIIPCSHVGHIFRRKSPYKWRPGVDVLKKNSARLAEVWLDDYAKFYYMRVGNYRGDYGDVSDRVKLRNDLKCKSFKWYMENVFPQMKVPSNYAEGYIKNKSLMNTTCLDSPVQEGETKGSLMTYPCHYGGGSQFFELNLNNELIRDVHCLEYTAGSVKSLQFFACHKQRGNQEWIFNITSEQLFHKSSNMCLSVVNLLPLMFPCDPHNLSQKWSFQYLYKEKFAPK